MIDSGFKTRVGFRKPTDRELRRSYRVWLEIMFESE